MDKKLLQIPKPVIQRFSIYYHILNDKYYIWGKQHISSFEIAEILKLEDTQIRNDFMYLDIRGKPKVGYSINELKNKLATALGYDIKKKSILVGVGHLGRALVSYENFKNYGFIISYLFDINPEIIGTKVKNKTIYHIEKLPQIVKKNDIRIGIITTPKNEAQNVAEIMIKAGIISIWNFAPTALKVPENVFVQNENIADSLAFISRYCSLYGKNKRVQ